MKNFTLKNRLFTIIGLLMITTSFYAQNLLVNGDFEATVAPFGWAKNNNDILLGEKNAYSIHAGELTDSANCRMPGVNAARWITQGVVLTEPGTYTFKFTGRIQNAAPFVSGTSENNNTTLGAATLKGEIFPFEADGTTVGTTALATISTQSNTNTEVSTTVVIGAEVTKVQVKIGKDWNVPYIDDVYFGLPTTGINEQHILNIRVVTNNGSMTVTSPSILENIKVLDITGKLVQSILVDNQSTIQFPVSVKNGLYLIVATDNLGKTGVVKHLVK